LGENASLALDIDGNLTMWGDQELASLASQLANVGGIRSVHTNTRNTIYTIMDDGRLLAFGDNQFGQADVPANLGFVKDVAAVFTTAVALRENGTVVAWGENVPEGQAALGVINVPASATNVVDLEAGSGHVLALKKDGTVICWGANFSGECTVPTGMGTIVSIAAGAAHSIAMNSEGKVYVWGQYDMSLVPPELR
jgi:alpha-tubulin suppressor-like RCC1 family protein